MTPTSLLAGVLTGLLEGLGVALIALLVINLIGRRHRPAPVPHPVAEDRPAVSARAYTPQEYPSADRDRLSA